MPGALERASAATVLFLFLRKVFGFASADFAGKGRRRNRFIFVSAQSCRFREYSSSKQ